MIKAPSDSDILNYPTNSAIDSCAVTNLFSSRRLIGVSTGNGRGFLVSTYVHYECLVKSRAHQNEHDRAAMAAFSTQLRQGTHFRVSSIDVDDLRALQQKPFARQLGFGELSSVLLALKNKIGVMTDDGKARRFCRADYRDLPVRTTSHLVGWLVYYGMLTDGDVAEIKTDNLRVRGEKGCIVPYIDACFSHAMMLRLKGAPAVAQ